ncbi:MAG: hypothetical protein ACLR1T_14605 [Evtepia gabavorous]
MLQETLAYEVLSVVEDSGGEVATYGQIARLHRPAQERPPGGAWILRGPSSMGAIPVTGW